MKIIKPPTFPLLHRKHSENLLQTIVGDPITDLSARQLDILRQLVEDHSKIFTVSRLMSEYGLSDVTVRKDLKGLSIRGFLATKFKDGHTLEYIVSDDLLERLVASCEQKTTA